MFFYCNINCDYDISFKREKLELLGVKLEKLRDCRGFSHVYQALVLYKQLNGHLEVPRAWVVPSEVDGPWPRHLWGMRLGRTVYDIKRKAAYSKNYYQVFSEKT